jgi:hypothetical protein
MGAPVAVWDAAGAGDGTFVSRPGAFSYLFFISQSVFSGGDVWEGGR